MIFGICDRFVAWFITVTLSLGLVFVLVSVPAVAQRPLRELPAAANPPPQLEEDAAQAEERIPDPPGRARAEDLIEQIRERPGGRERAEAATNGVRPGGAEQGGGRGRQQGANFAEPVFRFLAGLRSWLIEDAHAQSFSIELTPQVGSYGRHTGLRSSRPNAYAYFYGGFVNSSQPSNDLVYLAGSNTTYLTGSSGSTHPAALLSVTIPNNGWYIVNMNCYCAYSDTEIRHYDRTSYTLIERIPRQYGWADYPTLEYLSVGTHYFSYATASPTSAMYVSRLTVQSFP
jgi:hypothetical protein